jgi:hypothetical protein
MKYLGIMLNTRALKLQFFWNMKKLNLNYIQIMLIFAGSMVALNGCSSMPGNTESSKEISAMGPSILNVRLEPSTVELNRNLQPIKIPEILADVKDFRSKITHVTLRFKHVPLQISMENVGGTTWRAILSPEQLQNLAVSGKTITYDANVIARNQDGQVVESNDPINIAIKAPDLSQNATS